MKKIFILVFALSLVSNTCLANNYQSTKSYKLNEYNSKGQKVSYTKVYYKGDKSNIQKVEVYSTNGRQTKQYRR